MDECSGDLARAARRNGSLLSVRLIDSNNDICLLDRYSRQSLNKYAARIQGLACWSAAPESIPATAAFAHALFVAQVIAVPSAIFGILVKWGPSTDQLLSAAGEVEEELDATVARPAKRRHLSSPPLQETMCKVLWQ